MIKRYRNLKPIVRDMRDINVFDRETRRRIIKGHNHRAVLEKIVSRGADALPFLLMAGGFCLTKSSPPNIFYFTAGIFASIPITLFGQSVCRKRLLDSSVYLTDLSLAAAEHNFFNRREIMPADKTEIPERCYFDGLLRRYPYC